MEKSMILSILKQSTENLKIYIEGEHKEIELGIKSTFWAEIDKESLLPSFSMA